MGLPQIGERGTLVGRRDGVAAEVAETCRPPFQLLATFGHEPRPVGNLRKEGLDVGGQRSRGTLSQPQRGPSVQALPLDGLKGGSTGKRLKRNCPPARTYARILSLTSRQMAGSR